jgi:hypothetical protein
VPVSFCGANIVYVEAMLLAVIFDPSTKTALLWLSDRTFVCSKPGVFEKAVDFSVKVVVWEVSDGKFVLALAELLVMAVHPSIKTMVWVLSEDSVMCDEL